MQIYYTFIIKNLNFLKTKLYKTYVHLKNYITRKIAILNCEIIS